MTTAAHLGDLKPDTNNARKHTLRGQSLIETSLSTDGFGRSILLDSAGNILAGNGVTEAAGNVGLEDVLIVPSDGTKVIAIQRTDVEPGSERAVRLAIADNRANELSDFDPAVVAALANEVDLSDFWRDEEMETLLFDLDTAVSSSKENSRKLTDARPRITVVLLIEHLDIFEAALAATENVNRGEALIAICEDYLRGKER